MSGKIPMGADGEGGVITPVRLLTWGVASAIGILVCLVALLHLPPVQGVVVDYLIQTIEDRTGLKIVIAGHGWQPLSQLDLNGLSIGTGESRILECDRARVTYGFSIWRPFVRLEDVTLEKPVIHLDRDKGGRWQISRPDRVRGKAAEPVPRARFPLDGSSRFQVRVVGGTVLGQVNGQEVLAIRNISGSLPFRVEPGEDGPRIRVDLEKWQAGS